MSIETAAAKASPTEVVAIDGPSGAGKSTVARTLADRLGFAFLDTGAMYRAITWRFLERACAPAECAGDPDHGTSRMRAVLAERQFPVDQLRLFASARSAGRRLPWADGEVEVGDGDGPPVTRADGLDAIGSITVHGLSPPWLC